MRKSLFCFILSALLGMAGSSSANVLTLQPDDGKDTQLANGELSTNSHGDGPEVVINWAGNLRSIGLVQFDLGALPSGATVTSATFSLFHTLNVNNGSRYDVFRVTSAWNEDTVTFDTRPSIDPLAVASLVIGDSNTNLFRDWNVTGLVAGWADGSFDNFGLWVEEVPIQGDATAYFASSDFGGANTDPALRIEYRLGQPVPLPGTLALMAIGLLGLGVVRRKN